MWHQSVVAGLEHLSQSLLSIFSPKDNFPSFERKDLTSHIDWQRIRSLRGVLDNIGDSGRFAVGAKSGVVIASPSTVSRIVTLRDPSTGRN